MSVSLYGSGQTVIQVVQGTNATQTSTTTSTWVATNLTASITPQSTTSKILILISTAGSWSTGGQQQLTIYRGATNLGSGSSSGFVSTYAGNSTTTTELSITYLDSPSTTSSITYTLYLNSLAGTVYQGTTLVPATIQLLEISGS